MKSLSVAFLTPSLSREAGGIFEVERNLAQHLAAISGIHVSVYGTRDDSFMEDESLWSPTPVHAFPYVGPAQFRWSPELRDAFHKCADDVAHLHALWMYTSVIVRRWARHRQRPYITTLHGMLDEWALRNSRWKKRLCGAAYERSCLDGAACIHAFTEAELVSARKFGLRNPVCLVPNGVTTATTLAAVAGENNSNTQERKAVLYLGRIHPKKGLGNLLHAWHLAKQRSPAMFVTWRLVIAGWNQGNHEDELKSLAACLGIEDDVQFVGPKFGEAKTAIYNDAEAFVLPSFSEGLPMVVLEAWAAGKPVLMTPQCNLPQGFEAQAAISSEPDPTSLSEGLATLMGATNHDRREMGRRGRKLVMDRFTWERVAAEMHEVYQWVVGGGQPPASVVRN